MNKTTAIASSGVALAILVGACGGSVTHTASTGTGGTAATSTSSGTGGGTTATTTGTTSSSGSTTGSSSSGGPTCPGAAPANLSACTSPGETCSYGDGTNVCDCKALGDQTVWECYACPATQPSPSTMCAYQAGNVCTYGSTTCSCSSLANRWVCGTCPTAQPTSAATCQPVDLQCSYQGTVCTCESFAGPAGGGGIRWDCVEPCPATKPTAGATCDLQAGTTCPYGTTNCTCQSSGQGQPTTWFCN